MFESSFAQKTKGWAKLLAILLPSPCIGVILVYIAKYRTVSGQPSVDSYFPCILDSFHWNVQLLVLNSATSIMVHGKL